LSNDIFYLVINFWIQVENLTINWEILLDSLNISMAYIVTFISMLVHILGIFDLYIVDLVCIFLFLGAMGKSAQLRFHIWLPDAMKGPTPVSALMHAAIMVTAGIFLLIRSSYLFELSTNALHFVAVVGALTALV
jgi:NADH-quinone oxidoreductase subunit L